MTEIAWSDGVKSTPDLQDQAARDRPGDYQGAGTVAGQTSNAAPAEETRMQYV